MVALTVLILTCALAQAQQSPARQTATASTAAAPASPAMPSGGPTVDNAFVQKQFGTNCTIVSLPPVTGDLDGDGIEDIVIPARCTSPMQNQSENHYLTIDPMFAFFGYGNPAITTQYSTEDPQRRGYSLLIIHGAGADAWRSDNPKAKFLVVNLSFTHLSIKKLNMKKKTRQALYVEEDGGDGLVSVLFWDGKKYRYQPMGASME
jgi:hypothetical protein